MTVIHQLEQQRFVITHDEGEAVLEYRLLAENGIDFCRTYVPVSRRGQGCAERLVEAGLLWAREQELNIQASCWYVRGLL